MASFTSDCPHCGASKASFQIFGGHMYPYNSYRFETVKNMLGMDVRVIRGTISAAGNCPHCLRPIAAQLAIASNVTNFEDLSSNVVRLTRDAHSVGACGFGVESVWPLPPEPRIPAHLPANVEHAFLQAERAFARGDTDAAGMMYRRALETALKIAFPDATGSLFQRITTLVKSHDLPPAIGQWAHEVRIIGNDAAHDTDSLSVEDMTSTRNFVDAVLRYAISLPKEIELRRAATAPASTEAPALPAP